ncbi:hypothetical protein Tco_1338511 [Tanacetum coccineum]
MGRCRFMESDSGMVAVGRGRQSGRGQGVGAVRCLLTGDVVAVGVSCFCVGGKRVTSMARVRFLLVALPKCGGVSSVPETVCFAGGGAHVLRVGGGVLFTRCGRSGGGVGGVAWGWGGDSAVVRDGFVVWLVVAGPVGSLGMVDVRCTSSAWGVVVLVCAVGWGESGEARGCAGVSVCVGAWLRENGDCGEGGLGLGGAWEVGVILGLGCHGGLWEWGFRQAGGGDRWGGAWDGHGRWGVCGGSYAGGVTSAGGKRRCLGILYSWFRRRGLFGSRVVWSDGAGGQLQVAGGREIRVGNSGGLVCGVRLGAGGRSWVVGVCSRGGGYLGWGLLPIAIFVGVWCVLSAEDVWLGGSWGRCGSADGRVVDAVSRAAGGYVWVCVLLGFD